MCVCVVSNTSNQYRKRVLKYTNVKITDLEYFALAQLGHRKACADFYEVFVR